MDKDGRIGYEKPKSLKHLLNDFCSYTTAHGLGRLSESSNVISRLIWSLFCIGASTMFVLQVYNLFSIYLSHPVSTTIKVEHESVSVLASLKNSEPFWLFREMLGIICKRGNNGWKIYRIRINKATVETTVLNNFAGYRESSKNQIRWKHK